MRPWRWRAELSMSNGGMVIKGLQWGHKMGGTETVDLMQAALQDPLVMARWV